jgi:outer membrane protein assembly factor BamB
MLVDPRPPVIDSLGNVYFLGMTTNQTLGVFVFDRFGQALVGWPNAGLPSIDMVSLGGDGTVYAASGTAVYALNRDGSLKWTVPTQLPGPSILAITPQANGNVAVSTSSGVFVLDPAGALLWQTQKPTRTPAAAGVDSALFVSINDAAGGLAAYQSDGALRWTTSFDGDAFSPAEVSTAAVGADGTIYAEKETGSGGPLRTSLVAIDPMTGRVRHERLLPPMMPLTLFANQPSPSIGPDGTVYILTVDQQLLGFSPDLSSVRFQYSYAPLLPVGNDGPVIGADGMLYLALNPPSGGGVGTILALDPTTSTVRSQFVGASSHYASGGAISHDGLLYWAPSCCEALLVFGANPLGPMVTTISPGVIVAHSKDQRIVFGGSGFQNAVELLVTLPGGSVVTLSGTQIVRVAPDAIEALVTFHDAGRYLVTARNPDGLLSNALSVDVLAGPTPWVITQVSGEQLDRPTLAPDGSLRVMGFVYDCCGVASFVNSFAPDGGRQWRVPAVFDPDSFAIGLEALLTVDGQGRAYVRGHDAIPALDPAGKAVPGWPVSLPSPPSHSQWPREALNPLSDPSAAVTYISTAGTVSAYRPDGSLQWATSFAAGVYPPILAGGELYAIVNGDPRTLFRLDKDTGAVSCSAEVPVFAGTSTVAASPAGLWTGAAGWVTRYDKDCHAVTFNPASIPSAYMFGGVGDVALGFAGDSGAPFSGERLFALGTDDVIHWTNPRIRQTAPVWNPLRASLGTTAYIAGVDRLDGRQKLFAVDVRTGEIRSVLDTADLCNNVCGVAAAQDGTIYIGMSGSTLYKLRWPRFDQ